MLANHTSIRYLFKKTYDQFQKLYQKKAFLDRYAEQKFKNFQEFWKNL